MPYIDLHTKPFDNGTIAKLEIFEDYAEAWLPTFIMRGDREIHVFDFFSGPGYDCKEVAGSPIRLLRKVEAYKGLFFQQGTKIVLHLNEFEPDKKSQGKFETLKNNCNEFISGNPRLSHFLTVEYYNENAETLFFKLLPLIRKFPSLVYLDQNGVKFISKQYVLELEKLQTTDFLYFVSSSYFKRLGGTEEFRKVLEFDSEELAREKQSNMHRLVASKLREQLPPNSDIKLFPFSIRKGTNIYGIVFGAKHPRAVDKFLGIAWKRNNVNGEADFDIDDDSDKLGFDLFGRRGTTKIEKFKLDLKEKILSGDLVDSYEVLMFTYQNGHIPAHATEVLKELRGKKLAFEGRTAGVNYANVFAKSNIVRYSLIK